MKIPPVKPYFSDEDIDYIFSHFREILEGKSFLSQYKYCEEFEKRFAEYVGSKFAVTVSNGTASLEIIYRTVGIKEHDVVVATNTMAATVFAVIHAGGRPVFADCTDDITLDPEEVRRKITSDTMAVVTVHVGGLVSPHTKEIREICKEKGLYLIEDAAHAHGSKLDGRFAGTFGEAGSFSFYSTKVMTTGEGGMITTNNEEICEKALLLRNQAKEGNRNFHREIGHNWRMTEVQALMGLRQLEMLDKFIEKREHLAEIYDGRFEDISLLKPLKIPSNVRHSLYKYIVFTPKGFDRDKLKQELKQKYNVSLGGYVYDVPCHLQPAFKQYATETLPISEHLCAHHICPPMYHTMTDEEAHYVLDSIEKCIKCM